VYLQMIFVSCLFFLKQLQQLSLTVKTIMHVYALKLSIVWLDLQSIVILINPTYYIRSTNLLIDEMQQLPIISEVIKTIVVAFDDIIPNVCKTAINGFVEFTRYGNVYITNY
jgi:hypothetical protein